MPKFLHTRIRVGDRERSIQWYEQLSFVCARRTEKSPAGNRLAFLELPGNEHCLELCYSPDYRLQVPEDLMHTAVGYPDLIAKCTELSVKWVHDPDTRIPYNLRRARRIWAELFRISRAQRVQWMWRAHT